MANECAGQWNSKRFDDDSANPNTPVEELVIEVDNHTGPGITGRRIKGTQTDAISPGGRCTQGHGSRPLLRFTIREAATGRTLTYRGFVNGSKIAEGFWRRTGGPPDGGDTGTWEASKEGGIGEGDRKASGSSEQYRKTE